MTPEVSTTAPAANAPHARDMRHPVFELLGRYKAIFKAAWKHRHELAGPRRLSDEAAFLPAALSLQDTPVHPAPRRLAYALIALFLIALTWSIFGQIDIVAVAPGKIIVSERTKIIQPLEVSVVKRVLVRDGDHVEAGQALVELDPTTANADKTSIDEQLKSVQSEVLRTRALLQALNGSSATSRTPELGKTIPSGWTDVDTSATQAQLSDEWSDITAKLAKAASEINRRQAEIATVREMVAKLETTVPIAKQREADFHQLANQGFMSSHANQDRTRERIELERDLATQRARLAEANATLRESENTRSAYIAETKHSLRTREAAAELKRQQGTQDLAKAGQRERLTTLKAPVAGTVQQLVTHTEGGVVTEAQPLMVIVPDGAEVTAEVTLDNKDIGFVSPRQEAAIKLETFPYTRYGTVNATVKTVTADAVNDEKRGAIFPVTLSLGNTTIDVDGRPIKLSPGMNLTAEIKTGKRRVIEFLLSPVQKATSESMRER
ncbi:HlyD family type I secretion periplasmic adaptor subunit [Variovorax sp. PAMC26660]|uniref:HlyD family type I secretion periplasmic adaptor subunit n=1 Tax=Variovorax sp. PAMC26660 TaxID=2762322 RepID=UPI00164E7B83|nr:HlyD family type I secretion periplasmic adaptor subunit [Variovorax sp. PAMC26660]QNK68162.1 HlyD family type I secretion periplasmic adaptor subunit [Variovorax sp. PAMC26660]